MSSFVITPLSLKGANIFLSNYLEEGSPHMDGLHFCLTDGSPIKKNPSESKSLEKKWWWWFGYIKKKQKKRESMFKGKKNGEHIRGKWIYDEALFKDHCSKIPSHLFEFLRSTFAFIPLALTTIQA